MSRSTHDIAKRRLPLGPRAGRGAVLGLFCLAPVLVGCQTVTPWAQSQKTPAETPAPKPGEPVAAKTDFHRQVTPDQQYNVHMELGRVYESGQQIDAAIAEYQKALESCDRHGLGFGAKGSGERQSLAHRRIAGALDRLGRFAQAETHYRTALKLSPDDPKVWNDSGYSLYLQSRWTDAERNLKTAAKLAPDDVRIQTNLGLALAAAGKTDEALTALSKAGGPAVGHANLGYLLAAMGKTDEARKHYETALNIQPNLAAARQALTTLASMRNPSSGEALSAKNSRPAEIVATSSKRPTEVLATSSKKPSEVVSATNIPMPRKPREVASTTSIPMPRKPREVASTTSIPMPRKPAQVVATSSTKPSSVVPTTNIPMPRRPSAVPTLTRTTAPRPTPTVALASTPRVAPKPVPSVIPRPAPRLTTTSAPRLTPPASKYAAPTASASGLTSPTSTDFAAKYAPGRTSTNRTDPNVTRTSGPRVTPVIVPPATVLPSLPPGQ
jgi:Tfp pilus assembly protein PilF